METTAPDPQARRRVLDWIAAGRLNPDHAQAALITVAGQPRPEDWRRNLDRLLLGLGVLLALAGLVLFIAANWDGMGRPTRFALAQGAVVLGVAIAWWQGLDSRPGKAGVIWAAVAVGPLLALIGQTYQTGADPWQLFAAWLMLISPWIGIARSALLVLLGVILANTTIGLAWDEHPWRMLGDMGLFWFLLGLNSVVLPTWEFLAKRLDWMNVRWAIRVPALASLWTATMLVLAVIFGREASSVLELLPFPILLAVGFRAYRRQNIDLVLLSAGCLAVIVVITSGTGRAILGQENFFGFLLTGLLITALTATAGIWLRSVSREVAQIPPQHAKPSPTRSTHPGTWEQLVAVGLATGDAPAEDTATDPWPLRLLQGAGGWLGALLLMIALAIPVGFAAQNEGILLGLGLVLCAANVLTLRQSTGVIGNQFALALSLAGQGAVMVGMMGMNLSWPTAAFVSAAVAMALFFAAPAPTHRGWCAGIASGALISQLIHTNHFALSTGPVALGIAALLLTPPAQARWRTLARPLSRGLLAGWAGCFLATRMESRWSSGATPGLITIGSILEFLAILGVAALVLRNAPAPQKRRAWLMAAAAVPASLGLVVPGASVALAIILVALEELDTPFLGLGVLTLLGLIWAHYQLDYATPLVVKGAGLAGMGFAALSLWFILRRTWAREYAYA
ncbi:MAG: DUF4401 domain-containing protein [Verrucomicrobia bacterium]|nr:DUF4401 domain-containing protein [Verrucomicrobiota bacterium]